MHPSEIRRDLENGRAFSPPTEFDLARCEDEAIRIPGAVQPHACLMEIDSTLTVLRVSSNLRVFLGKGAAEILGQTIDQILGAAIAEWLHTVMPTLGEAEHRAETRAIEGRGTLLLHRYRGQWILEWIADSEHRFAAPERMDRRLGQALLLARREATLPDLLQQVAEAVKDCCGYDRVMVYRFHADWHGEVVAEKTEPGLIAFRGLHYPASDIPAQARDLYLATRVRAIVDVYARDAVLMESLTRRSSTPLDLSHAFSRSVSPVHIQYLRNMGSGATLVSSLVVNGKLWGLIACHHRTRYPVPWYAFSRMHRFTDEISAVIQERVSLLGAEKRQQQDDARQAIVSGLAESLEAALRGLLRLVDCESAVLFDGNRHIAVGTPLPAGAAELPQLVLGQSEDIGVIDGVGEVFPELRCEGGCAGLAWLVLSRQQQTGVLLVRPEFERTVSWGGNPEKAIVPDPVTRRLNPRGSFDTWRETVRGRSRPWASDTATHLEFFRQQPALTDRLSDFRQD